MGAVSIVNVGSIILIAPSDEIWTIERSESLFVGNVSESAYEISIRVEESGSKISVVSSDDVDESAKTLVAETMLVVESSENVSGGSGSLEPAVGKRVANIISVVVSDENTESAEVFAAVAMSVKLYGNISEALSAKE